MSRVLNTCLSPRLTVLTYHRIGDSTTPSFVGFGQTVSATAEAFAQQIAFLDSHCQVVSLSAVLAAIRRQHELPSRAVLITFDDGYRDTIEVALPLLAGRGLPAAVFLATDHVGGRVPFFWDAAAYLFDHARDGEVRLPLLGYRRWADLASRGTVIRDFVQQLKRMPDRGREAALAELSTALDVTMPSGALMHLHMTWDDARRGTQAGLEFGSHTMRHAMLTGLGTEDASAELMGSKARLERELGLPAVAFAYPNGDCSPHVQRLVQEAGYEIAFSCRPGPSSVRELRAAPFEVRRVEVISRDTLPMFAAKLVGLARIRWGGADSGANLEAMTATRSRSA